nr:unnamed protein product [Callosobruchus analis]
MRSEFEFTHTKLLKELRLELEDWFNYLRMNKETHNELLKSVSPQIKRLITRMRIAITPYVRLAATLAFFSYGQKL